MTEFTNLEDFLRKNGIQVSIIEHDINRKFGRFYPMEYKSSGFPNDKCHVIKISYPCGEPYDTKANMQGEVLVRSDQKKWTSYVETDGWIVIKNDVYREEVLWWFCYGDKPTVREALGFTFRDFQFLYDIFSASGPENLSYDTKDADDVITLFKALEEMGGEWTWEQREQQIDVWYRMCKLHNRLYGCLDNGGLGKEKFEQLKEILENKEY